ncbi:hypothetical protein BDK51DRAFT_33977 [Blyttiomyces helicus]|uniref:Uncharacterized protein n=1 Tax=Blyttiomyces helicus TaxID=388810 RepID=A0A4P9WFW5_9FUNG|nr:hypothetical protein BDK51DRAFT_33977 [Blyttiomyces helicus]|eukprot:RKO90775.1 hypothetical protein BDK51DRAFT_33977 [Blyttiomyces helicus]
MQIPPPPMPCNALRHGGDVATLPQVEFLTLQKRSWERYCEGARMREVDEKTDEIDGAGIVKVQAGGMEGLQGSGRFVAGSKVPPEVQMCPDGLMLINDTNLHTDMTGYLALLIPTLPRVQTVVGTSEITGRGSIERHRPWSRWFCFGLLLMNGADGFRERMVSLQKRTAMYPTP